MSQVSQMSQTNNIYNKRAVSQEYFHHLSQEYILVKILSPTRGYEFLAREMSQQPLGLALPRERLPSRVGFRGARVQGGKSSFMRPKRLEKGPKSSLMRPKRFENGANKLCFATKTSEKSVKTFRFCDQAF